MSFPYFGVLLTRACLSSSFPAKSASSASMSSAVETIPSSNTAFLTAAREPPVFAIPTPNGPVQLYLAPPAVTSFPFSKQSPTKRDVKGVGMSSACTMSRILSQVARVRMLWCICFL
jgi:hypothetical protein